MGIRGLPARISEESRRAYRVIRGYVHETPIEHSATLSRISGGAVHLKLENLQKTGSFKVRGALYKVWKTSQESKGYVAASAGNHAQGVAYAASAFKAPAIIVMPESASISKIQATRGYGAEVVLYGRVFDESLERAVRIAEERGYTFIHAFDDLDVIAGQGTIAYEALGQLGDIDLAIVPVGGGGLISGVASVLKSRRSGIRVIGVEPKAAPKMLASIKAGRIVEVEPGPTAADGLAAKSPGRITYQVVSEVVDDIVLVDEEEIAEAIYLLLERGKVLVEGAGSVGVAAIISGAIDVKDKRVLVVVSGGNIDLTSLYRVLVRGLTGAGRIARITGYVLDSPGQLKRVLEVIARNRGNIIDIYHDRSDPAAPAWHAKVTLVFEVPGRESISRVIEELRREGYKFALE